MSPENIEQISTFEQLDEKNNGNIFHRLSKFFRDPEKCAFPKKILYCPGTAPMRPENSEILSILYATDFDEAWLVDPFYEDSSVVSCDFDVIKTINAKATMVKEDRRTVINFVFAGKIRTVVIIAGDATEEKNMPLHFNIYFSGRRVFPYVVPDSFRDTIRNVKDHLQQIINRLPHGGYFFPDRDSKDDREEYFQDSSPESLRLHEIEGIREPFQIKTLDQELRRHLTDSYLAAAVASGTFRPPDQIPMLTSWRENFRPDGTYSDTYFPSIDAYFEHYPELRRSNFIEEEGCLYRTENDQRVTILQAFQFSDLTPDEEKVFENIERRAYDDAIITVEKRGIGLYCYSKNPE